MATVTQYKTRFEGRVNVLDLPALKSAVVQMSDTQLTFYYNTFARNHTYKVQQQIVRDEMVSRSVVTYNELYGAQS